MELNHVLRCARTAKKLRGPGPLSTGEALAAAIVLNKPAWIKAKGYTLAEAMNRVADDGQTIPRLVQAQRIINDEG
ncbi:hypothetical protein DYQ93_11575 [Xanthomonas sp. LMG 8992]|uniref:hypothetical protein n=1 Tax=Xanthomonas sp. LMG 8992 TaxID=1591157 RepID=UPI001368DEEE|nr:hypothetical protein [Xanthomonas sp. LMG 8992]MXV11660.1 hypothetical protein [Xanthomonas sp. LMG 8992]